MGRREPFLRHLTSDDVANIPSLTASSESQLTLSASSTDSLPTDPIPLRGSHVMALVPFQSTDLPLKRPSGEHPHSNRTNRPNHLNRADYVYHSNSADRATLVNEYSVSSASPAGAQPADVLVSSPSTAAPSPATW